MWIASLESTTASTSEKYALLLVFPPELWMVVVVPLVTPDPEPELLLLDDNETFHTVQLAYKGGPRYPSLSRLESPDWLSEILEPKVTAGEGESN